MELIWSSHTIIAASNRLGRTDRGLEGEVGRSGGLSAAIDLPSHGGGPGAAGEEQPNMARWAGRQLGSDFCIWAVGKAKLLGLEPLGLV